MHILFDFIVNIQDELKYILLIGSLIFIATPKKMVITKSLVFLLSITFFIFSTIDFTGKSDEIVTFDPSVSAPFMTLIDNFHDKSNIFKLAEERKFELLRYRPHIRIMNIKPKYKEYMSLPEGKYKVEVSCEICNTKIYWVNHTSKDRIHRLELEYVDPVTEKITYKQPRQLYRWERLELNSKTVETVMAPLYSKSKFKKYLLKDLELFVDSATQKLEDKCRIYVNTTTVEKFLNVSGIPEMVYSTYLKHPLHTLFITSNAVKSYNCDINKWKVNLKHEIKDTIRRINLNERVFGKGTSFPYPG